ncbi:hypothetical protein GFY24_01605 [Nocardia sp. SYP-A9097]|uniref:hypothetical protein n=1 Tax=Nocardia sp. SYP-A9097 TaxID=2663237 RepID=UPI00129B80AA|nr:hypothetical protein [Nocardia sp. SYP-A9097]MRH86171.1 hypothetical protein [Nocardia sp. SYP-A9097]
MSNIATKTAGPPSGITQHGNWLASAIPATGVTPGGGTVGSRSVRDGVSAVRQIARIQAGSDLALDAPGVPVAQQISVKPEPIGPEPVSPFPTHKDWETGQTVPGLPNPGAADASASSKPAPGQQPAPVNPAAPAPASGLPNVLDQMYVNPAPQPESPKTLAELAVPGYKEPAKPSVVDQLAQQMIAPAPDPAAASTPKTLTELAVPGYKEPPPVAPPVTVTCTTVVPVPGLPKSITGPTNKFRVGLDGYGFNYPAEQLAADLALVRLGPVQTVSIGPTPYQQALERLSQANYTIEEQNYDLQWAFHNPEDADEKSQQAQALTRLREIGINPYGDPEIEKYAKDQLAKTQYLSSPGSSARNAPPPPPRPKMTSLGDDLYGMFVEPAVVLWEAAHGKGNHSAGAVAWAAAEFGLNASMFIPGVGAVTSGARVLRVGAAELMTGTRLAAALTGANDAIAAAFWLKATSIEEAHVRPNFKD